MNNSKSPILQAIPNLSREEIEQIIEVSENALIDRVQQEKAHALQQIVNYVIRNKILYTEIYDSLIKANALYTTRSGFLKSDNLYKDPDNNSNVWNGVGRKPNWLRKKLTEGHGLEEFLVSKNTEIHRQHYFYNPEDISQKWNGIGRRPTWLRKKLAAGYRLEDFLVSQPKKNSK